MSSSIVDESLAIETGNTSAASAEPQPSLTVFADCVDIIMRQPISSGIGDKFCSIVATKTYFRSQPEKALPILQETPNSSGQSISGVISLPSSLFGLDSFNCGRYNSLSISGPQLFLQFWLCKTRLYNSWAVPFSISILENDYHRQYSHRFLSRLRYWIASDICSA